MEVRVFLIDEELVDLLNEVLHVTGCCLFVGKSYDDSYSMLEHVAIDDLRNYFRFDLGRPTDAARVTGRPVGQVYREDRIGFVSLTYLRSEHPSVLLETNFHADPSETASLVGKALRKYLRRMAHKGVIVRSDASDGEDVAKDIYWTEGARNSRRVWRQFESSLVFFMPKEP